MQVYWLPGTRSRATLEKALRPVYSHFSGLIDVFVDELVLSGLGFKTMPEATGRPGYHPALMLKLFIYG